VKLKIIGEAYAEAAVNLTLFMDDFATHEDMEQAIKDNTTIVMNKHKDELNEEDLKTLVWGALDWGGLLDLIGDRERDIMLVRFFLVEYKDWIKLYPNEVKHMREWDFLESNESGVATLLVQDLVPNPNFDLKSFIKEGQFTYASTEKVKVGWRKK
jgi:hypothetical protein